MKRSLLVFLCIFALCGRVLSGHGVDPEDNSSEDDTSSGGGAGSLHDKIFGGNPCAFKKCPPWTLLSSCKSPVDLVGFESENENATYSGNMQLSFQGHLEVTTNPESYEAEYDLPGEHADQQFGKSRILIDVKAKGASSYPTEKHVLLNQGTCSEPGDPYHQWSKAQHEYGMFDDSLNMVTPPQSHGQHNGSIEHPKFHPSYLQYVDAHNFIVEYWRANSITLTLTYEHDGEEYEFEECCDLEPIFPDFPSEWTADIEYTISDKMYTGSRREYYSDASQKIRIDEHNESHRFVQIEDVANELKYTITRNESYPNGFCESQAFGAFETHMYTTTGDEKPHLRSTSDLLMRSDTDEFIHVTEARSELKTVRGIPSQRWSNEMIIPQSSEGHPVVEVCTQDASYNFDFHFPTPEWKVRNEHYHRLLNRIYMDGKDCRGNDVTHYYDFINFRPYIEDADTFNPCHVFSDKGGVTGCGCEDEVWCTDNTGFDSGSVDDFNTHTDPEGLYDDDEEGLSYFNDKIHISKKTANGITTLLFFIGTLCGFGLTVLYFRKKVGVKLRDNFKAQSMGTSNSDVEMSNSL